MHPRTVALIGGMIGTAIMLAQVPLTMMMTLCFPRYVQAMSRGYRTTLGGLPSPYNVGPP